MSTLSLLPVSAHPFDALAPTYDADFTRTLIGRAQRDAVWRIAKIIFHPDQTLLELNCGTGEDALFFARNGIAVVACDASLQMVRAAAARRNAEMPEAPISFHHLPTERLAELPESSRFDGAFSNFSGLNFLPNVTATANILAHHLRPGSSMLLCLSTRVCLAEIFYYLLRGRPRKALRRLSGHTLANLSGQEVSIYYPTLRHLRSIFSPHFELVSVTGIGVAVPPSYVEPSMRKHPRLFRILCDHEPRLANLPILRVTGDNMLLQLCRRPS